MKKKQVNLGRKLTLSKEMIGTLSQSGSNQVKGGATNDAACWSDATTPCGVCSPSYNCTVTLILVQCQATANCATANCQTNACPSLGCGATQAHTVCGVNC